MDQPKLERLLRLMKMLTGNATLSVADIAVKLNMSVRTVYRYIDTFRAAGFVIKSKGLVFRIDKSSPYFKDISSLVHFTEEEAYILKSAIESIDENNVLKQNLKKKLYTIYNYRILADSVFKGKQARIVNLLVEAIETGQQVVLRGYSSAHSKSVSDRVVEPFGFTTNYIQIWAFEHQSQHNKLFKIARIGSVELLPTPWVFKEKHCLGHIDVFRISNDMQYDVTLKLGIRAAMLLAEEYPLAERDMKQTGPNEWLFRTKVCSYEGVGRFYMGLAEDIKIVDTPDFEMFIRKKMKMIGNK